MRRLTIAGVSLALAGCLLGSAPASADVRHAKPTVIISKVKIVNFAFKPATLNVAAGTVVKWVNKSTKFHTSTSDTGAWDSSLAPGATFKRRFKADGTFAYHCALHNEMVGTIVVSG
jgi:plastocyanin